MFTVIGKQNLNAKTKRIDVRAEHLVAKLKPGQFVAVMVDRFSRRLPFNVYDIDWRRKCLSIVFEVNDPTTERMGQLKINDDIFVVSGPYGVPCPIEKKGTVVCVGEGIGLASLAMLCRSLKQIGNKVIGIAGFEERKSSILENQIRLNCSKFYVMYKDGMHERRGDIFRPLDKVLAEENIARVYAHTSMESLGSIYARCGGRNVPMQFNAMEAIAEAPAFWESGYMFLNNQRYFPAVEGVMLDAAKFKVEDVARRIQSTREYSECRKKEAESSESQSAFARLKKLVWG